MKRIRMLGLAGLLLVAALVLASCGGFSEAAQGQDGSEPTSGTQGMETGGETQGVAVGSQADIGLDDASGVKPTMPVTPSVDTMEGELKGNTRTFRLTASEFEQKIANFPIETATVWGYNGSTPGPTLVANEGEQVRVVIENDLPPTDPLGPEPPGPRPTGTTIHFHGMHVPNEDDGVAGISQPEPIMPGETFTYKFTPGHAGSFAYHSHTDDAVQELRGLDGMFIIQPESVAPEEQVDVDVVTTLQQFAPVASTTNPELEEGALVQPFPPGTGDFPFSTINGKTGEAAGEPITIEEGDRVRIRIYNASNLSHSMHMHGHDITVVSKNGHPVGSADQNEETTQNVAPGDFFEIEFTANNPGNWIFHCHVPHHTSNAMLSGYNGAPVGMTRVFHYAGYEPVPPEYFAYPGLPSPGR